MTKMKHVRQATKHISMKSNLNRAEVVSHLLPLCLQLVRKHLSYPNAQLGEEIYQLAESLLYFSYDIEWSEKKKGFVLSQWMDQLMEWGTSFEPINLEEGWEQLQRLISENQD